MPLDELHTTIKRYKVNSCIEFEIKEHTLIKMNIIMQIRLFILLLVVPFLLG